MKTIIINGVKVKLNYRFSELMKLGKKWGLKTPHQVLERIVSVSQESTKGVSFDALDVYADIVIVNSVNEIPKEEIINHLFDKPADISEVVSGFLESIRVASPGEEEVGDKSGKPI